MTHFIQISDLHIGEICGGQPDLAVYLEILAGGVGHEPKTCEAVREFIRKEIDHTRRSQGSYIDPEQMPKLILTGDITSCGGSHQFTEAFSYLQGSISIKNTGNVGWGAPDWRDRGVGGNHDQWGGGPLLHFRNSIRTLNTAQVLGTFPRITSIQVKLRHRTIHVRLIMIDTDADVRLPLERPLARGRFSGQLRDEIIEKLRHQQCQRDEVRVLVMHHSPSYEGSGRITDQCRADLAEFIREANIRVILCGHTHKPKVIVYNGANEHHDILEACCGTTTQCERVPIASSIHLPSNRRMYNWLREHVYPRWPQDPVNDSNLMLCANALLTHTLEERENRIYWCARTFFRSPNGFESYAAMTETNVTVSENIKKLGHQYSEQYEAELAVL